MLPAKMLPAKRNPRSFVRAIPIASRGACVVASSTLMALMTIVLSVGMVGRADAAITLSATDAGFVTELYGNLAGGPSTPLGSVSISAADDSTTLSIPLDPGGITYLNDFVGGAVMIGGSVPTALPKGGPLDTPQQPFGSTGPDIPGGDSLTPKLVLTVVPEPGSLTLVTCALFGLNALRRRRQWN